MKPASRSLFQLLVLFCLIGILGTGCKGTDPTAGPRAGPATSQRKVIAQGQILPAGGFIQLSAQPGDVAEDVQVAVGDYVETGETLVVMRSKQLLDVQKATLRQQRIEAEREQRNAIEIAQRQTVAAELKQRRAESQKATLKRKAQLLQLAESQVETSRHILSQLETISRDRLTSEFVGSLEIDRQRLAANEARLALEQQREAQLQIEEDLAWAIEAADVELASAQAILKSASESDAIKIIDLQIAALELQNPSAEIVAPEPGIILAVNVTKGESSVHLPIIEMANTTELVCEIEINEMDASNVRAGQLAQIHSRAFEKPLTGEVQQKYSMVGRPQLRSLDPLARADYRSVTAIIRLDAKSTEVARDWLQLQVEVEIQVGANATAIQSPAIAE